MLRILLLAALLAAASVPAAAPAAAQDDDGYAWINTCKARNMGLGADDETAHGYCACIDHEMGDDEVNDIAGWEKANPDTAAECREAAGWE